LSRLFFPFGKLFILDNHNSNPMKLFFGLMHRSLLFSKTSWTPIPFLVLKIRVIFEYIFTKLFTTHDFFPFKRMHATAPFHIWVWHWCWLILSTFSAMPKKIQVWHFLPHNSHMKLGSFCSLDNRPGTLNTKAFMFLSGKERDSEQQLFGVL
jgi:hypothetical protein